ncbi:MAG: hypothetical protein ACYTAF_06570 [Planctomycetota bacterium]
MAKKRQPKKKQQRRIIHREIDGELGRAEKRALRKRVRKDAKAREEYDKLKIVSDTTRRMRKVSAPRGFSGRVVREIRRGRRSR